MRHSSFTPSYLPKRNESSQMLVHKCLQQIHLFIYSPKMETTSTMSWIVFPKFICRSAHPSTSSMAVQSSQNPWVTGSRTQGYQSPQVLKSLVCMWPMHTLPYTLNHLIPNTMQMHVNSCCCMANSGFASWKFLEFFFQTFSIWGWLNTQTWIEGANCIWRQSLNRGDCIKMRLWGFAWIYSACP